MFATLEPTCGDPIDVLTGSFLWNYTDLNIAGKHNLKYTRYYNSVDGANGVLGKGWSDSFRYTLEADNTNAYFTTSNGSGTPFKFDKALNKFVNSSPLATDYTLQNSGGNYIVKHVSGVEYRFDSSKVLKTIYDDGVLQYTYFYDANGNISEIKDKYNGSIYFTYIPYNDGTKTTDLVSKVTDFSNNYVNLEYSGNFLTKTTNSDGDSLTYTYDANGNMLKIFDFNNSLFLENRYDANNRVIWQYVKDRGDMTISYDTTNRVTTYKDPKGVITKYFYDENNHFYKIESSAGHNNYKFNNDGQVKEVKDKLNRTTTYEYDGLGRQNKIIFPDGTFKHLTYNSDNKIIKETYSNNTFIERSFDSKQNLIKEIDQNGNSSRYVYNTNDELIESYDKEDKKTTYKYDSNGNLSEMTDPLGKTTRYQYSTSGKLLSVTTPKGLTTSYEYSPAGKLLRLIHPDGASINYQVDKNGRSTSMSNRAGDIRYITYDTMGSILTSTDFSGNITKYEYDAIGRQTKEIDPLNYFTEKSFDQEGNLKTVKDKNGNVTTYNYDAESQLTSVTDANNSSTSYVYDLNGRVSTYSDARNAQTKYEYDSVGRVQKEIDAYNNEISFTYDNNGNVLTKKDKNGNVTTYSYDKENRVKTISSTDGSSSSFEYDANGRLIISKDSYQSETKTSFDGDGHTISESDKEGNLTKYEYDSMGRITKEIYADNTFSIMEYDVNGNLSAKTDSANNRYEYKYDKNNRRIETKTPLGSITKTTYNKRGEVSSRVDAKGGETTYSYDGNGNKVKEINQLGGVKEFTYDSLNRIKTEKDEDGGLTEYTYDQNGNVLTIKDANGNTKSYTYDLLNRNTQITNALSNTYKMSYDSINNLTEITDEEGHKTFYEYDLAGRITKITDALGHSISNKYDNLGRVIEVTDQNGATTKKEYTRNGNISKLTTGSGSTITFTYDNMDRTLTETDAKGHTTSYTYNELGQVLTKTNALNGTTKFTYDALGRIKTVTDSNNNTKSYTYDLNGNVINAIGANGIHTSYEYDALNNMTKMIVDKTGKALSTIYKYNNKSQTIEEINASGLSKTYKYDQNGNLVEIKDEEGNITKKSYDASDNLKSILFADGTSETYIYNKKGELVEFKDFNGTTKLNLDPLGRLKAVTDQNSRKTSYEYDGVGNKTAITYPNNDQVFYTYDAQGRMIKAKDSNGETAYSYDINGNLLTKTSPNSEVAEYTYDTLDRKIKSVESLNGSVKRENIFEYDRMGNITKEQQKDSYSPLNKTKTYSYDKDYRLTTSTENGNQTSYLYDNAGNLTKETSQGIETAYTYNNLNQLVMKKSLNDTFSYTYDKRGNMLTESKNSVLQKTYAYNYENLMIKGENKETGEESSYAYNALGKRVSLVQIAKNTNESYKNNDNSGGNGYAELVKQFSELNRPEEEQKTFENLLGLTRQLSMPKIKTDFVIDYTTYNNNDIMAYEGGSYITRYTYGANEEKISQTVSHHVGFTDDLKGKNPLSQIAVDDIKTAYIHSNYQGGTSYVTDKDGQVLSFAEYDPWGKILNEKPKSLNSAGLDDITDYTGHTYDEVIDKYFAKARFYDAVNKRFISEDPIKDGTNWYGYVNDNPVNDKDITGLSSSNGKLEADTSITVEEYYQKKGDLTLYAGGVTGIRKIVVFSKNGDSLYFVITENVEYLDVGGKHYFIKGSGFPTGFKDQLDTKENDIPDREKGPTITSDKTPPEHYSHPTGWIFPLDVKKKMASALTHGQQFKYGRTGEKGPRAHGGIDLAYPVGTKVIAMTSGIVRQTKKEFYLNTDAVDVQNDDGYWVRYAEIKYSVIRDQKFNQGDTIGEIILNSYNSKMLHLEVYVGQRPDGTMCTKDLLGANSEDYLYSEGLNYNRREDIIDPMFVLDLPLKNK